ncbi:MAG: prolyl aminopeptidase [Parachlamydiaceae bacterium]|nr:prolyl aminopeptidase [Parachlamydiaceae bacterium]
MKITNIFKNIVLSGAFIFSTLNLHGTILFSNSCDEVCFDRPLNPICPAREEGYLKVSEKHTLFYAVYGNPKGVPVIVLHGGPGAGCSDSLAQAFDLNRWNVIMFDQRGAMRSEPFCCMEENSPDHSISDIESLRKHLGIEKWMVVGGSWGSSLALLYGQEHSEQCIGFILRGVWLVREQDYLHLIYGMGKIFPEAYEPVVNHIPEEERHDLLSAYYRRVCDPDPNIHMPAARAFMRFDFICSTHLPNSEYVEKIMQNDKLVLGVAKAFFHFAKHNFFLEPNRIISRMQRISHLPAIIINGRWDAICPSEMAYSVHKNWSNSKLWIVSQGGHTANEQGIAAALSAATDIFADEINE